MQKGGQWCLREKTQNKSDSRKCISRKLADVEECGDPPDFSRVEFFFFLTNSRSLMSVIEETSSVWDEPSPNDTKYKHFAIGSLFMPLKNTTSKVMREKYGKPRESKFGSSESMHEFVVHLIEVLCDQCTRHIIDHVGRSARKTVMASDVKYALRMLVSPVQLLESRPLGAFLARMVKSSEDADANTNDEADDAQGGTKIGVLTPRAVWHRVLELCKIPNVSQRAVETLRAAMEWFVDLLVMSAGEYATRKRKSRSASENQRFILTPFDVVGGMLENELLRPFLDLIALPSSFSFVFFEHEAEQLVIPEEEKEEAYERYRELENVEKKREKELSKEINKRVSEAVGEKVKAKLQIRREREKERKQQAREKRREKKRQASRREESEAESSSEEEDVPPTPAPESEPVPVKKSTKRKPKAVAVDAPATEPVLNGTTKLKKREKKDMVPASSIAAPVIAQEEPIKKKSKPKKKVTSDK